MRPLKAGDSVLELVWFIKTAPFRSVLGFILLLPLLLFALAFAFILGGYLLEFLLTFLLYGLAGLASENDYDLVFSHVSWPAKFCWNAITFMTFGEGFRLFLMFPYAFAGFWLLGSAARDLRNKHPDKPQIYKWFQNNKKTLLANDCSPELSYWRANEIVQSYADVLARGGRGRIADASLLPHDKETIRAAIDRHIEDLISRSARDRRITELIAANRTDDAVRVISGSGIDHELEEMPGEPNPELERIIGILGAIKQYLFDFQDIDPEDKEAVALLNSYEAITSRPASVEKTDWHEFLQWENRISLKYSQRRRTEIERLAAGDKTITVKRKESQESNKAPSSQMASSGMVDLTSPKWVEILAEVKRRVEESRTEDPRTWEEIVSEDVDGKS